MAYRKVGAPKKATVGAKKRTHHRTKRRVGAAGGFSGIMMVIGGLVLGGAGARFIATQLGKLFPALMSNVMLDGVLQMGLGYFLPKFIKGTFFQFVGYGMIASGGQTFLVGTGVISGTTMSYRVGGTSNLKVINGTGNLKVVGSPYDNRVQNQMSPGMGNAVKAKGFSHYGTAA